MADKQRQRPARGTAAAREDRLAAALRANIARRKAQQRQRATEPPPPDLPERED